ncbi:dihydroneopterin aldolase [Pleionea litopenaei]|uniref:7,8-dihydroneopterin aldolase n=1 Tax=Pleionea litopenaei TaxID=3070815 RepID=A0AA51RQF7_9GAMM|nr:dihydroneopterin aldolase [Pleionea sp. HL-JVS1]WMS85579.1 dihydroneopterin aldolase [Pleionea sp. HL-JVS1]
MDTVFIEQLTVDTVIGVYDWERKIRQKLILDVEMGFDIKAAAASDDLSKALDYSAVATALTQFIESTEFKLVETLVEQSAELVLNQFAVAWVKIKLAKPGAVRGSRAVGVTIMRTAEGHGAN